MGLSDNEILRMRYGEMQDMIACFAIDAGGAEQDVRGTMPFEEVMRLK